MHFMPHLIWVNIHHKELKGISGWLLKTGGKPGYQFNNSSAEQVCDPPVDGNYNKLNIESTPKSQMDKFSKLF
jgi:hypothetical protein